MIYLTFLLNITFILQFRFVGTNSVSIYCFMDYFICHHKTFFHIDIKTFNHWIHKEHYVCVLRMRGDKNPTSWPLSILIANICIGNLKLFLLVAQTNHITHKTEMKHSIIYRNPVYVVCTWVPFFLGCAVWFLHWLPLLCHSKEAYI